jgi:hypothetical protein
MMAAVFDTKFDEGLDMYDSALEDAEDDLFKMGLPLATRPSRDGKLLDRPQMPSDVEDLGFGDLKRMLAEFTAWYEYAIDQHKKAISKRNAAQEKRTFAWRKIRRLKDGTVADKDDGAGTDSRYLQVAASYEYADSLCRMLDGIVEGLKRNVDTVSRLATVLEQEQDTVGRSVGDQRGGGRRQNHQSKSNDMLSQFRTSKRRHR